MKYWHKLVTVFKAIKILKITKKSPCNLRQRLCFRIPSANRVYSGTESDYLNFSNSQCSHHIETSQLICFVNQVTVFYMMGTLVVKRLSQQPEKLYKQRWGCVKTKENSMFNEAVKEWRP